MKVLLLSSSKEPLVFYGFLSGRLPNRISFARNSSAQCIDGEGTTKNINMHTPRFDHDPITHEGRGLLVEPQKTNRVRNSNGASWATVNTAITLNDAVSPEAITNGFRVTDDGANTYHTASTNEGSEYIAGTAYTSSVYLKAGTQSIVQMTFPSGVFNGTPYANFNLSTGAVAAYGDVSPAITPAGGGWFRCSITATAATSTYSVSFILSGTNNNESALRSPTYQGTGLYYSVFGAQGESGSFRTSYIPTTGTAATRAADQLSFAIPKGVTKLRYTFDDNTYQDVAVNSGAYTVPTNLNRPRIKFISSE